MSGFQAPKGVAEYLPPSSAAFTKVRDTLSAPPRTAGYGYAELAVFEDTGLFVRGVGESTDVVTKEMYTFSDRGGRSLTLRPEGTAPAIRAALEHGLHRGALPAKLWYCGPFFRAERPQAGRYRQFHQVGVEALGSDDPALDAEVVTLASDGFAALDLTEVRLDLTSLGCRECRPAYRELLQEFLRGLDLDEATRARVEINPLRVLDDKRPDVRAQLDSAPLPPDHLCDDCRRHHDAVRGLLADVGVVWHDEPRLVRGLDYYTRTTFEFVHESLGAQSGVGGGGRYDGLSEDIGGPLLPGVGWALGIDRTVLALAAEGLREPTSGGVDVFGVPIGDEARRHLYGVVTALRRAGVAADLAFDGRGAKGAMKAADRSGAVLALVLGQRDIDAGVAQLKDLATGEQSQVPIDSLVGAVTAALARR